VAVLPAYGFLIDAKKIIDIATVFFFRFMEEDDRSHLTRSAAEFIFVACMVSPRLEPGIVTETGP
jgi:hypothetical protein